MLFRSTHKCLPRGCAFLDTPRISMLPNKGSIPIFDLSPYSSTISSSNQNTMGEGKWQNSQDRHHQSWAVMEESDERHPCSSIEEEASTISSSSTCSSSSFDTTDDAASSSSYSSSVNSSGSSLYDLSDLMSHLPIKRGLSKFYHGKSDSFTSLARVVSIEDLPKKENNPYNKMKASRYKSHTLPKPVISKNRYNPRGYSKNKRIPEAIQSPSAFPSQKQLPILKSSPHPHHKLMAEA